MRTSPTKQETVLLISLLAGLTASVYGAAQIISADRTISAIVAALGVSVPIVWGVVRGDHIQLIRALLISGKKTWARTLALSLLSIAIGAAFLVVADASRRTRLVLDEGEVLNEWVGVFHEANSEERAISAREKFLEGYRKLGHLNGHGLPMWENDVRVVRSPQEQGVWLVVIDLYHGPSSEECAVSGIKEIQATLHARISDPSDRGAREVDNILGETFLKNAWPLCMDLEDFECTWGRLTSTKAEHLRSQKSCKEKLNKRDDNLGCGDERQKEP